MSLPFSDGFESGNLSAWTSTTGNPSVQSTTKYQGSYAMQAFFSDGGFATKTFSGQSLVYHRFYVRFSDIPTTDGSFCSVSALKGTDYICWLQIYNQSGTVHWVLATTNNGTQENIFIENPTVTTDTWYCVEYSVKIDGSAGEYHIWIDGTEKGSLTGKKTDNFGNVTSISDGAISSSGFSSGNVFVDCVVASDSYIGPLTQTYNLTISTPSPSDGGTTNPSTGTYAITANTYQDVSANTNSGYTFDHWILDSNNVGSTNPYSVYMNSDHTLQAVFVTSGGSLSATPPLQLSDNVLSIPQANSSTNGYLSASDWNVFNSKYGSGSSPSFGIVSANDYVTTNGYMTASGGTSNGPAYRFSTYGPAGYFGGQTGVGLNSSGQIVLNSGFPGGVVTATAGTMKNTLDDGLGNIAIPGTYSSSLVAQTPVAGSNAGMKLDCWPATHRDGIGLKAGGLWLKYGDEFNIYHDDGTTITNPLHIDLQGNMTLNVWGSRLNFYDQYGHQACIYADNSSSSYPFPFLHFQYGILADDITAHGFIGTSSDTLEGGYGGGAIMMGHGLEWPTDPPRITMTDYSPEKGGYRELALTAGSSANYDQYGNPISYNGVDGILADLRLSKLTLNAISSVSTGSSVAWNNYATSDWSTIGGFLFNNTYNGLGMEFKCTTHNFNMNGDTTLYPVMQILFWENLGTPQASFITVHQFDMNGDYHLLGDLHYAGRLINSFDSIDDFATLKSLRTIEDEKGTKMYDKDTLAFLKDDKGLLSLSSCLGWELSVQQKFLAKHEQHEVNIANLLKRIEALENQEQKKNSEQPPVEGQRFDNIER